VAQCRLFLNITWYLRKRVGVMDISFFAIKRQINPVIADLKFIFRSDNTSEYYFALYEKAPVLPGASYSLSLR
jgi:hypothetical protein